MGSVEETEHYDVMEPAQGALESAIRYAAHEQGPKGILVHTLCRAY